MVKVTIDRATWWRGNGSSSSKMLREDGNKCCLGFAAESCGYTAEQMLKKDTPGEVVDFGANGTNLWPFGVVKRNIRHSNDEVSYTDSNTISNMMIVNDAKIGEGIYGIDEATKIDSEEQRERILTELAKSVGLEFEFVGEGHPQLPAGL